MILNARLIKRLIQLNTGLLLLNFIISITKKRLKCQGQSCKLSLLMNIKFIAIVIYIREKPFLERAFFLGSKNKR